MKQRRTNVLIRHFAFKMVVALVLAVAWTFLIAYLLYGYFIYNTHHLIFDLCYAFLMFYLFYEGYTRIVDFLEKRFPRAEMSAEKYLIGLAIFLLYGLIIFLTVGYIPSKIISKTCISLCGYKLYSFNICFYENT